MQQSTRGTRNQVTAAQTTLQGYQPAIHVYSTHNLQHQASLTAGASFGYTAVALSHDGELLAACADRPDLELTVWQWRKVGGWGRTRCKGLQLHGDT